MSFSAEIKRELCEKLPSSPECRRAMLCGLLDNNLRFFQEEAGIYVYFESPYPAEACYQLIKDFLHTVPQVRGRYGLAGAKFRSYEVLVPGARKLSALISMLWENPGTEAYTIGEASPEVERAYLAGAFMGCGLISEPKKKYHLELNCRTRACAEAIAKRLEVFDVTVSARERGRARDLTQDDADTTYICYLKSGEKIADFLRVIGAYRALLELEDTRVYKEMVNTVNRQLNCELSNMRKSTGAAGEQVRAIESLQEKGLFETLDPSLKEIALLRLENPELSVTDLGAMLSTPLTKSGTYHRLQKLVDLAKESIK